MKPSLLLLLALAGCAPKLPLRAAGVPADRLPLVTAAETNTPVCSNNPVLTARLAAVWRDWLGEANVTLGKPLTFGEDFARFGRERFKVSEGERIKSVFENERRLGWGHFDGSDWLDFGGR